MSESTRRMIAETAFAEEAHRNIRKNQEHVELLHDSSNNLSRALKAERKLAKVEEENDYYRNLLAKPMLEIAKANGDFRKTYEMQMTFVAEWMVSQKAFKELAIEFGAEKGYTPEQVIEMGLDKEIDVLEDKNDPSHNTNVGNSRDIKPRKDQLIEKFHKDKAVRKAKKDS